VTVIEYICIALQTKQAICMGSSVGTLSDVQILKLPKFSAIREAEDIYLFTVIGHWLYPERDESCPCPEIVMVEIV